MPEITKECGKCPDNLPLRFMKPDSVGDGYVRIPQQDCDQIVSYDTYMRKQIDVLTYKYDALKTIAFDYVTAERAGNKVFCGAVNGIG